jgi:hypothetical protein
MTQSELDAAIVAARRSGRLAGQRLRFNRPTEQMFFHYRDGRVDHVPTLFRGTRRCSDNTQYDEYVAARAPDPGYDAVIHTHQDRAPSGSQHFPFPGTRDGVTPKRLGIPNYGLSSVGTWVVRPGTQLSIELLDGIWGARFNPEAFAALLNRGGGDVAVGMGVVCR